MALSLATSKPDAKQSKSLPSQNSDFYEHAATLNPEELMLLKQVRAKEAFFAFLEKRPARFV